jgi:hypothetical protein
MTRKKEDQIQVLSQGVQQNADESPSDPTLTVNPLEKEVVDVFTEQIESVKEKETNSLIYLGPNLPGGRLLQSTVFREGIPAYLEPLLIERPEVKDLIIPLNEMIIAQKLILQTGTAQYVAYQALMKGEVNNNGI